MSNFIKIHQTLCVAGDLACGRLSEIAFVLRREVQLYCLRLATASGAFSLGPTYTAALLLQNTNLDLLQNRVVAAQTSFCAVRRRAQTLFNQTEMKSDELAPRNVLAKF